MHTDLFGSDIDIKAYWTTLHRQAEPTSRLTQSLGSYHAKSPIRFDSFRESSLHPREQLCRQISICN